MGESGRRMRGPARRFCVRGPNRGPGLARRDQALPTLFPLRAVRLPPHANRPSVDHATRLANARRPGNPPESIRHAHARA